MADVFLANLRAAIRARRLALKLTTIETACRAGIHQSAWARIETGDRDPNTETLRKVASALGWSVSRLVREAEK